VRRERGRLDGRTRLLNARMGAEEEGGGEATREPDGGRSVLEFLRKGLIEDELGNGVRRGSAAGV